MLHGVAVFKFVDLSWILFLKKTQEVCKAIMINVQNKFPINNRAYAHQYFNNLNQMFL